MEPKEYLYGLKRVDFRINARKQEIERLENMMISMQRMTGGTKNDNRINGGRIDRKPEIITRIEALKDAVEEDVERYIHGRTEMERIISGIRNERSKDFLTEYFLYNQTIEQIAENYKKSRRQMERWKKKAIMDFEEEWKKTEGG